MLQRIEDLNRAAWGDKVTLATTAHFLGGLGIGLLVNRRTAEGAKPLGYVLVAISMLAHLYASLTMPNVSRTMRERSQMSV
jgi:hypothetical protein